MAPMNWPATPGGCGLGIKCRKPFNPKTTNINPRRMREIATMYFLGSSPTCCTQSEYAGNHGLALWTVRKSPHSVGPTFNSLTRHPRSRQSSAHQRTIFIVTEAVASYS